MTVLPSSPPNVITAVQPFLSAWTTEMSGVWFFSGSAVWSSCPVFICVCWSWTPTYQFILWLASQWCKATLQPLLLCPWTLLNFKLFSVPCYWINECTGHVIMLPVQVVKSVFDSEATVLALKRLAPLKPSHSCHMWIYYMSMVHISRHSYCDY